MYLQNRIVPDNPLVAESRRSPISIKGELFHMSCVFTGVKSDTLLCVTASVVF